MTTKTTAPKIQRGLDGAERYQYPVTYIVRDASGSEIGKRKSARVYRFATWGEDYRGRREVFSFHATRERANRIAYPGTKGVVPVEIAKVHRPVRKQKKAVANSTYYFVEDSRDRVVIHVRRAKETAKMLIWTGDRAGRLRKEDARRWGWRRTKVQALLHRIEEWTVDRDRHRAMIGTSGYPVRHEEFAAEYDARIQEARVELAKAQEEETGR